MFLIYGHVIQVNEKGQLRLSHRALLPDVNDNAKQQKGGSSKENVPPKDGSISENATPDRLPLRKIAVPPGKSPTAQETLSNKSLEKVVRRPVSTRDRPYVNEDRQKKSGSRAVTGLVATKDGANSANGETKNE